MTARVKSSIPASNSVATGALRICLLDGFLLYSPAFAAVQPQFDLKIFLRASYEKIKARREARDGYVTLDGFWKDPPGYVDKIVWPNYVREHEWLFEEGNVEGKYRADVLEKEDILVVDPGSEKAEDGDLGQALEFCADVILQEILKHS